MPDPTGPYLPDLQPTDALFLDIDGTLLDIAPHPDEVIVPKHLPCLLMSLRAHLGGALAIISGRSIEQVDALLAPAVFAGAGEHGAVLRVEAAGNLERLSQPVPAPLAEAVLASASRFPAVEVEQKSSALAVHFRNAPDAEIPLAAELAQILTRHPGWTMMRGRRVFDVIPQHVRKGGTLALLANLPPFRGRRPVMIGDDVTDLSAFEAAASRGGLALKVASNLFAPTQAHFADPQAVRSWLTRMSHLLALGPSQLSR